MPLRIKLSRSLRHCGDFGDVVIVDIEEEGVSKVLEREIKAG